MPEFQVGCPEMSNELEIYLSDHPVFTVVGLTKALGEKIGKSQLYKRLRRLEEAGKVTSVVRGVYSVVTPGQDPQTAQPDPFLVLAALRPDVIFCGHSALELLGTATTIWNTITGYSVGATNTFRARNIRYKVMQLPNSSPLQPSDLIDIDRSAVILQATGPELTLVEGFRHPKRVGGIEELVKSADTFRSLDLAKLQNILDRFQQRRLYAAVGWFISRERDRWNASATYLHALESRRPKSRVYLERGSTMSVLA